MDEQPIFIVKHNHGTYSIPSWCNICKIARLNGNVTSTPIGSSSSSLSSYKNYQQTNKTENSDFPKASFAQLLVQNFSPKQRDRRHHRPTLPDDRLHRRAQKNVRPSARKRLASKVFFALDILRLWRWIGESLVKPDSDLISSLVGTEYYSVTNGIFLARY